MNWKKTSLCLAALLAGSLTVNLLFFSGCFGGNALVREKDALLDRFQKRITDLEEENRAFRETLAVLQTRLEKFLGVHNQFRTEMKGVMEKFKALPEALPPPSPGESVER